MITIIYIKQINFNQLFACLTAVYRAFPWFDFHDTGNHCDRNDWKLRHSEIPLHFWRRIMVWLGGKNVDNLFCFLLKLN